jgi:hypothetical protein
MLVVLLIEILDVQMVFQPHALKSFGARYGGTYL